MVNFGLLAAEILSLVWGTPANFNGFRVLAVLLHGTVVVGISQTLRRWTEGATCIRQGVHHVGQVYAQWLYARIGCDDADVSLEDSGNYTCEINGPLNSLLGSVTHYVFVRGTRGKNVDKLCEL